MTPRKLTFEEALSALDVWTDEDTGRQTVHCLRGPFGADWDLASVEAHIREHGAEMGGPACRRLDHGLVVRPDYFFAHDEERFRELETGEHAVRCEVCNQDLGLRGGMGGTGLCGPCCTGKAASMEERGETW